MNVVAASTAAAASPAPSSTPRDSRAGEGEVSLAVILPLARVAAALGDLASFWLGTRLGRRFLLAHGPRLGVTATRAGPSTQRPSPAWSG
ncbi:MAG: hypothetical protein ACRDLY_03525 [Thermoleophilaceae bacterium]